MFTLNLLYLDWRLVAGRKGFVNEMMDGEIALLRSCAKKREKTGRASMKNDAFWGRITSSLMRKEILSLLIN